MKINGRWSYEETDLRKGIVEAFKTAPSDTGDWRASIDGLTFPKIKEEKITKLEPPFTLEEVFAALSDLNGDKAPGPDGFTVAFWQFS